MAYDCDVAYERGYEDGLRENEMRWISTEDRLPNKSGEYLVVVYSYESDSEYISIEKFYERFYEDGSGAFYGDDLWGNVIYWMPIPKMPE